MGRGFFGARVCLAFVAGLGLVGCQPLYGGKPEKLPNVARKKAPAEAEEAPIAVKEVDDCQADFRGDPKNVRPQASLAVQLTSEGDAAVLNSEKATSDPSAQIGLLKEGVDKYRSALLKDPYNAEATLKLALAYERLYRKGCAIAMLKRLAQLSKNPKYARTANPVIDSIGDNASWFKRWRKEANAAVER